MLTPEQRKRWELLVAAGQRVIDAFDGDVPPELLDWTTYVAVADALTKAERERDEARALVAGATAEADARTEDALALAGRIKDTELELAAAVAEVKRLRAVLLQIAEGAEDLTLSTLDPMVVALVARGALAEPAPEGQG